MKIPLAHRDGDLAHMVTTVLLEQHIHIHVLQASTVIVREILKWMTVTHVPKATTVSLVVRRIKEADLHLKNVKKDSTVQ